MAALSVACSHIGFHDPSSEPLIVTVIMARLAVMIFFALSGFVLALPFFGPRPPSPAQFFVRRICRIYLPYLAAMAFGFAVLGGSVVPILTMAGTPQGVQADPPTWSLVVEMRYSLIFPLLVLAVARRPAIAASIAAALSLAFWLWAGGREFAIGQTLVESLLVTSYFGSLFVGGIIIAKYRETIERFAQVHLLRLWMATIVLTGIGLVVDPCLMLAGVAVVALVPVTPLAVRAAGVAPIVWLGRVSYSLYLVNWIVQAALLRTSLATIPMTVLYFGITFLLAELGFRFVEQPSIALGRRLTMKRAAPD